MIENWIEEGDHLHRLVSSLPPLSQMLSVGGSLRAAAVLVEAARSQQLDLHWIEPAPPMPLVELLLNHGIRFNLHRGPYWEVGPHYIKFSFNPASVSTQTTQLPLQ